MKELTTDCIIENGHITCAKDRGYREAVTLRDVTCEEKAGKIVCKDAKGKRVRSTVECSVQPAQYKPGKKKEIILCITREHTPGRGIQLLPSYRGDRLSIDTSVLERRK